MAFKTRLMKTKWYPRPHDLKHSWYFTMESGVENHYTIYPIMHTDEGLSSASAYEANPEHASFVEADASNCFADSEIQQALCRVQLNLAKDAIAVDALTGVRCCYMPIFTSFIDDYTAIDELSSIEVQDALELTTEATDRQGGPLFNDVKMVERFSNSALLGTTAPFLTTTQVLEGVTFQPNVYYDMLQYRTNHGKLKNAQGGLKWITLTKNRPNVTINFHLRSKSKRANPFTFFGILLGVPKVDSWEQIPDSGDTTNVNHVSCQVFSRYYEWNENFNFAKV